MQDSQLLIPPSFTDLLYPAHQTHRSVNWATLAQRHELCEDMAQLLTEHARQIEVKLGITEADVLNKVLQGLLADEARLGESEALWVACRLAELLGWPLPHGLGSSVSEDAANWLLRQQAMA